MIKTTKIYLVEDDPTIVKVVEQALKKWDYTCYFPLDFQNVYEEFEALEPQLVLLDISLPYFNGFYWCKLIREFSEVPIIFISSAEDKMNQIMAMNMGADDFIAKPFDLSVLVAKIQALLRRSYQYGQLTDSAAFSFGENCQFIPNENQIRTNEEVLPLSPNEARILTILFQQQGQIVARERIIEHLWQNEAFIDNNTLAVNITRLRKKLGSVGISDLIQTVKTRGYMIEGERYD